MHDFNPGILPNGVFWTMEIPRNSFRVWGRGRHARLRLDDLPMPDTFFFANNVSVSGQIDVDVRWRATSPVAERGNGLDAVDPFWDKFIGWFRDALCTGRAGGAETGFHFRTNRMTSADFFAEMGRERNGVFLS